MHIAEHVAQRKGKKESTPTPEQQPANNSNTQRGTEAHNFDSSTIVLPFFLAAAAAAAAAFCTSLSYP
jgi:hypothetical protein